MANTYIKQSPEQKAQKADAFAKSLAPQPHATNSVSSYDIPMSMLIDAYRDILCSSILKKHKALSKRDISFLQEGPRNKVPFYAHMSSTYGFESGLNYLQAVEMQRDAWLGKYDKNFIKNFLDSCDKYLSQLDKSKVAKA